MNEKITPPEGWTLLHESNYGYSMAKNDGTAIITAHWDKNICGMVHQVHWKPQQGDGYLAHKSSDPEKWVDERPYG